MTGPFVEIVIKNSSNPWGNGLNEELWFVNHPVDVREPRSAAMKNLYHRTNRLLGKHEYEKFKHNMTVLICYED